MSTLVNASRLSVESGFLAARAARASPGASGNASGSSAMVERARSRSRSRARSQSRSRSRSRDRDRAYEATRLPTLTALAASVESVDFAHVERELRVAELRRESTHRAVLRFTVKSAVATFLLEALRSAPVGGMFVQQYSISEPTYNHGDVVGYSTGVLRLAMKHEFGQGLQNVLCVQEFMMYPMSRCVEEWALNDLLDIAFHPDSSIERLEIHERVQPAFSFRSWIEWERQNNVGFDVHGRCYFVTRGGAAPPSPPPSSPPRLMRQNAMNF